MSPSWGTHRRTGLGRPRGTTGHAGGVEKLLLNYGEVADSLGISESKAKELAAFGILRAVSIGASKRVPVAELQRFVSAQLEAEAS
jgi:hypothetical protein